jgi:hypothetical protein
VWAVTNDRVDAARALLELGAAIGSCRIRRLNDRAELIRIVIETLNKWTSPSWSGKAVRVLLIDIGSQFDQRANRFGRTLCGRIVDDSLLPQLELRKQMRFVRGILTHRARTGSGQLGVLDAGGELQAGLALTSDGDGILALCDAQSNTCAGIGVSPDGKISKLEDK